MLLSRNQILIARYEIRRIELNMYEMRKINITKDSDKLFELVSVAGEVILPGQTKFLNAYEFQSWLLEKMNGFFCELHVIQENSETKELIGYALIYDYRVYDRHCSLCIYSTRNIEPNLWASFIDELFKEYPLNKVFWKVASSNIRYLELAKELGFSEEMVLKEYIYQGGRYLDVCVLGKSRKPLEED